MKGEMKISELIADIEHQRLILPEFQRGYVWTATQVREYVQSLYRGYPTGSFLIWRTPNPGRIRQGEIADSETKYFQLILDGQQRLTSVYTVLKGEPPPFYEEEALYFNLYFNLLTEEFAYYKKSAMQGKAEWIPVTEFLKQGLAEFFKSRKDENDVYLTSFDKLTALDAIRSYTYYLSTISEEDIERAVEIFNLVNSKGTRLSKSDLALAHICSSWPEARQTFRTAQAKLAELHFDLGLDILTRMASTVATGSALYEPLYKTEIATVKDAWKRVDRALAYVVDILRADAWIDSSKHLASPYPLVPLVAHLAAKGGTFSSQREKGDFLYWMYAALMWTRYSGSTDTKLNADVTALADPNPTERLRENILRERGRIRVQPSDLERAGALSSFFPMTYIVARARGAVDWLNGHPLYSKAAGAMFEVEAHHIFPSAVLYKSGYSSSNPVHKQLVNEIANLCFLTKGANIKISAKEPLRYLRDVRDKFPGALEAQFVPMNEALWSIDRFPEFLAERRRLIAEAINAFMDDLIMDEEDVDTTIEDLIAQGESVRVEYKGSLRWDYREEKVNKALTKSVLKTMAAFLNTDGGTLLIGVMDDGAVAGIESDFATLGAKGNRDDFELTLRSAIKEHLGGEVSPFIELTFAETQGQTVAIASCEPYHKPVFLEDGGETEFYVRAGNTSQPLNIKAANEYIRAHWSKAEAAT